MSNKTPIAESSRDFGKSIRLRPLTGNKYRKNSKIALAALSTILLASVISDGAEAKGKKKYVYECTKTRTVQVCSRHDKLGRCTRLKKTKVCVAFKKTRVSSKIVLPNKFPDKVKNKR